MNSENKSIHEGHRKRVREQFIKTGNLNNLPDHKILEIILFYSTPRADTNELAHNLIKQFGSLNGVFEAPYESLLEIKGIGEHSAVLLKLFPETVRRYLINKSAETKYIESTKDSVDYLRPFFETLKKEVLIAVCLNNAGKILKTVVISEGTSDYTKVDTRKLIQEVLFCNASQVILAHNHPGGLNTPSRADIDVTTNISYLLRSIHSRLSNHIIICDNDFFSFAAHDKFAPLFISEEIDNESKNTVAEGDWF